MPIRDRERGGYPKPTSFWLSDEQQSWFRELAWRKRTNMSALLRELIERELDQEIPEWRKGAAEATDGDSR